jgi:HupE / UreJ protein
VVLPSRLVEGGIALTIAYVAFDNFFAATTAHRWVLTFCFGLVHGFGFANVLREMRMPASGLIPTLLSFNVGVEIGQVAIAAVLFPVTLWLAKQRFRRPVVLAASGVIFLIGVRWFIQRAFD